MNYIHTLEQENASLRAQLQGIKDGLAGLLKYVNSAKFRGNPEDFLHGYVSTQDINLRVNEIKNNIEV
jgi:hypothetical protein